MKNHMLLTAIMCVGILVATSFVIPTNGSAATIYDPTWGANLLFPTGTYSVAWDSVDASGVLGHRDYSVRTVYSSSIPKDVWMIGGSYSLPEYAPVLGNIYVLPPAPDNSSIAYIMAATVITYPVGAGTATGPTNPVFSYSLDNGASYSNTSAAVRTYADIPGYLYIYWNITTMQSWTPAMVKSAGLYVKLEFEMRATGSSGGGHPVSIHYRCSVDYVGLLYLWYTPGGSYTGWTPESGIGTGRNTGEGNFSLSMAGTMSMVGLIGMIGMPASAVWIARETDRNRFVIFFFTLVAMAFFLALFLGVT